jgi:hypothetical protein
MTLWRTLIAWLTAMSADPVQIDAEAAKCDVAVAAAYATFAPDVVPAPTPPAPPGPMECPCGGRCVGGRYQPDGSIWQKCSPGCLSCRAGAPFPQPAPECRCGGDCSAKCVCGCRCPDGKCRKER